MRYFTIIPARAGSKGIPGKNKKLLLGKPLIQYTFEAIVGSGILSTSYVSSDDQEILQLAQKVGIQHFGLRPDRLAKDDTSSIDVILYELTNYKKKFGLYPDAVILLQPTSPLRNNRHILRALRLFEQNSSDSLVSVVRVPHNMIPNSVMYMDEKKKLISLDKNEPLHRRQNKPTYFARNGAAIYICRTEVILESKTLFGKSLIGYEMDKISSIDIDDQDDFRIAEAILNV